MQDMPGAMQFADIVTDTGGNVTLCAAQAGMVVDVWGFQISANGTTVAQFNSYINSTATPFMGAMSMVNGYPFAMAMPYGPVNPLPYAMKCYPLGSTASGAALTLTSSGGVAMNGRVYYSQRAATMSNG